ncbi:MAG: hypothetical protein ACJ75J_05645, partial [Cytophagaceae bacterium]
IAHADSEMNALFDMNNSVMSNAEGISLVSKHRQEELTMVTSPDFLQRVKDKKIQLVTYRDVIKSKKLSSMRWVEQNY